MSETRITDNGENVVYMMPPWVADELASLLITAATHFPNGKPRKPENYDQGWLDDAQALMDSAEALVSGVAP